MKYILLLVSIVLINFECTNNHHSYDEIQLSAITDSTYINVIIEPDSIIFYEIESMNYNGWGNREAGPKFSCHSIITKTQLYSNLKQIKIILSDTFKPKTIRSIDLPPNRIAILNNDSILKEFIYSDVNDENKILRDVGHLILKAIELGHKNKISYSSKLFDLSPIKHVDSIAISNTKLFHRNLNGRYDSIYVKHQIIKTVINKDSISNILDRIQYLSIIKSPTLERKDNTDFKEHYVLDLFKNGLIEHSLYTDEKILSYSNIQWLEVDSKFISSIK